MFFQLKNQGGFMKKKKVKKKASKKKASEINTKITVDYHDLRFFHYNMDKALKKNDMYSAGQVMSEFADWLNVNHYSKQTNKTNTKGV